MTIEESTGSAPHRLLLPAVFLSLATVISAVTSLNVALRDLAADTGASQTEITWIVDAYALVFSSLLLVGGALGDRYGRRLALLSGLAIFGIASAGAMIVDDVDVLIGLRAVMGIGAALVMPATLSTITTVFSDEKQEHAVAIWAGVAGASAILGLLFAGTLLEWFDWPSVFGLNVGLSIIAVALIIKAVPESSSKPTGRLDVIGSGLFVATVGTLVYSIIEAPTEGWTSTATITGLSLAAVLLTVTVAWELHHPNPLLDPRLFTHRLFTSSSLTIMMQFAAFFGFMFLLLQYLQIVGDMGPLTAATCMLPFAAGMMAFSRGSVKVASHIGRARTVIVGLVLVTASFFALSQLDDDINYWLFFSVLPFLGIGMGLAMTPSTTLLIEELPQEKQGVASAVNHLSRELGGAIGIAVMGNVMTSTLEDRLGGSGGHMADLDQLPGPKIEFAMNAFADGFSNALFVAAWGVAATLAVVLYLTKGGRYEGPKSTQRTSPSTEAGTRS